ncbi:MAG: hypothetical protein A3G75_14890 [Verrucomicrobia bacterium RIFCSPLOWO2_12_FULL_64_8]|nr:MAG: hypothetical protein A3G75_14890 [Verrucomicrobia bacterium RIFCSPLOWO2_12_FULL_64_8]
MEDEPWPSEQAETAFLAAAREGQPADQRAKNGGERRGEPLPPVEELARRIRPEVLETMDQLFRAKWTETRRVRPEDLKE